MSQTPRCSARPSIASIATCLNSFPKRSPKATPQNGRVSAQRDVRLRSHPRQATPESFSLRPSFRPPYIDCLQGTRSPILVPPSFGVPYWAWRAFSANAPMYGIAWRLPGIAQHRAARPSAGRHPRASPCHDTTKTSKARRSFTPPGFRGLLLWKPRLFLPAD